MSFDKSILHKKEHRKPYYGSKAVDITCRNHGSCIYCRHNRQYHDRRMNEKCKYDLNEYRKK